MRSRSLFLYLDNADVDLLRGWLNAEKSIAFIVPDGPERFKAVRAVGHLDDGVHWLWNVDAGALQLIRRGADGVVDDPWSGWQQEVNANDDRNGSRPWFGPDSPAVYQLDIRSEAWTAAVPLARSEDPHVRYESLRSIQSMNAMSGFYWNLSSFDEPPKPAAAWWARLGRWGRKQGHLVRDDNMSAWALPGAWKRAEREMEAWSVLWTDTARYCLVEGISGALNIYDRARSSFVHLSHEGISRLVVERMKERGVPVYRERPVP